MAWFRSRPVLIGAGAVVVAAIAIGVALAAGRHLHRRYVFVGPFLGRSYAEGRFGGGPYGPGPFLRQRLVAPHEVLPTPPSFAQAVPAPLAVPGQPVISPLGVLHAQITQRAAGGYETIDIQRGNVTKVGATSITVRSADGFTATYAVTRSTVVDAQRSGIGSVRTGDLVQIRASVTKGKATLTSLTDLSRLSR